ncbi:acyltransferase, partial [Tsukamurella paurometabola]|nr:acyltransferase [Tsukamurella paurometabola]
VPFNGAFGKVTLLTLVFSVAVAALSYAWVEEPARQWLACREARRSAAAQPAEAAQTRNAPSAAESVAPVG